MRCFGVCMLLRVGLDLLKLCMLMCLSVNLLFDFVCDSGVSV